MESSPPFLALLVPELFPAADPARAAAPILGHAPLPVTAEDGPVFGELLAAMHQPFDPARQVVSAERQLLPPPAQAVQSRRSAHPVQGDGAPPRVPPASALRVETGAAKDAEVPAAAPAPERAPPPTRIADPLSAALQDELPNTLRRDGRSPPDQIVEADVRRQPSERLAISTADARPPPQQGDAGRAGPEINPRLPPVASPAGPVRALADQLRVMAGERVAPAAPRPDRMPTDRLVHSSGVVTSVPQAPAPSAEAAPTAKAVLELSPADPQFSERIAEQARWLAGREGGEVRIRLNPPHLGTLEIKVQVADEQTFVNFSASQPAARELLEGSMGRLRGLMDSAGLTLADAQVSSGGAGEHRRAGPFAPDPELVPEDGGSAAAAERIALPPPGSTGIDLYA